MATTEGVRKPGVRNGIILGEACARINDPGYSREWWEASMDEWRFIGGRRRCGVPREVRDRKGSSREDFVTPAGRPVIPPLDKFGCCSCPGHPCVHTRRSTPLRWGCRRIARLLTSANGSYPNPRLAAWIRKRAA